jgi:hypothetical protein
VKDFVRARIERARRPEADVIKQPLLASPLN